MPGRMFLSGNLCCANTSDSTADKGLLTAQAFPLSSSRGMATKRLRTDNAVSASVMAARQLKPTNTVVASIRDMSKVANGSQR